MHRIEKVSTTMLIGYKKNQLIFAEAYIMIGDRITNDMKNYSTVLDKAMIVIPEKGEGWLYTLSNNVPQKLGLKYFSKRK